MILDDGPCYTAAAISPLVRSSSSTVGELNVARILQERTGALVQSASALLSVIPHVGHWISKELHVEVTELLKSPPWYFAGLE